MKRNATHGCGLISRDKDNDVACQTSNLRTSDLYLPDNLFSLYRPFGCKIGISSASTIVDLIRFHGDFFFPCARIARDISNFLRLLSYNKLSRVENDFARAEFEVLAIGYSRFAPSGFIASVGQRRCLTVFMFLETGIGMLRRSAAAFIAMRMDT